MAKLQRAPTEQKMIARGFNPKCSKPETILFRSKFPGIIPPCKGGITREKSKSRGVTCRVEHLWGCDSWAFVTLSEPVYFSLIFPWVKTPGHPMTTFQGEQLLDLYVNSKDWFYLWKKLYYDKAAKLIDVANVTRVVKFKICLQSAFTDLSSVYLLCKNPHLAVS
jgi:hypothetical protein